MSETTKRHLDEFAREQFAVELRQPKVLLLFHNNVLGPDLQNILRFIVRLS